MEPNGLSADEVLQIECNIDDMTAEALGYVLERLMAAGALDAWFTPIQMKKDRPATMLSLLCRLADGERLSELVLRETTTLGVRWQRCERRIANRRSEIVETPWGTVRCKLKIIRGEVVGVKPEHDDCVTIARHHDLPLHQVEAVVSHLARERLLGARGAADRTPAKS